MTPHTPINQLSHIQKSKQAYQERKHAKFITRAKSLTKIARLKKQLGLIHPLNTHHPDSNGKNKNDIVEQQHQNNNDTAQVTNIDQVIDITNTPSATDSIQHNSNTIQSPNTSIDTRTIQQKRIERNRIKQKMNSRTLRGQPHLNKQMEVLYTKLLQK